MGQNKRVKIEGTTYTGQIEGFKQTGPNRIVQIDGFQKWVQQVGSK